MNEDKVISGEQVDSEKLTDTVDSQNKNDAFV